jgi:CRP/FNR family nitrogen fixation transcriptional regulator
MPDGSITQSDRADLIAALNRIGSRRRFPRNKEIYAEDDPADCWFMVVSGTVRICKLLVAGRRHIAEFCYPGDCFGLDRVARRLYSAEAIGDVVVMRYPRRATEQLIADEPRLSRALCEMTLRDLAHAQTRILVLGAMRASERVASFLIELSEHRKSRRVLEVPMSRNDIADYLGITVETVCRVLTTFRNEGVISSTGPHYIELRNRDALAALCEA